LIWDNLNTHRAAGMREYAAAHDCLTIVQLPSYAPDLNPVEGIWSLYGAARWPTSPSPTRNTSNRLSAAACVISSYGPTSSMAALLALD
jgi:transposase